MVISNAVVCDLDGERVVDVRVENGTICEIGSSLKDAEVYDASGLYLLPSLFDTNIRLKDMVLNSKNILDVTKEAKKGGVGHIVLNPTTKKAQCFIINSQMTDFEKYDNMLLCRRVEGIADYMITKTKIQKSKKSVKDKEKFCQLNEEKNYNHKKIDEKAFDKFVSNI